MKRAVLSHPKTNDLASRLDCSRPAAIGYLSLLFDFCAEHSPRGDIGKWTNGAIARACDWLDDADHFVQSLIESKWLDDNELHRLLVHDWAENCDNWVRAKLKAKHLDFCSYDGSYDPSYDPSYSALTIAHKVKVKGKGKGKRFAKPTLENVVSYCKERKNNVNAQRFIDYYEANGWRVGKVSMKDWQAAVRNWEKNEEWNNKPESEVAYRDPNAR